MPFDDAAEAKCADSESEDEYVESRLERVLREEAGEAKPEAPRYTQLDDELLSDMQRGDEQMRRLVRHRINRRNDIVQRFRWRRHHNFERDERQGVPIEEGRTVGRRPRHKEPIPLPKSVGAIKDWRYYRRAASGLQTGGAIWTDLYNAPLRNVKKLGLVNKKVLQEDINGLEHICAIVAREQDAQQRALARRNEERCHFRASV